MANDLSSDVWVLDTASADPVYEHNVKIKTIIWEGPASQGDQLILKTLNGQYILNATCEADAQAQIYRLGKWYNGIIVDTIDSGAAHIHYV
jgi:hypothetical protein